VVFLVFLCFWQENTPERFQRGRVSRSCPWWKGLAVLQFFLSIFEAKSVLLRRPLVDTHPLPCLPLSSGSAAA